MTKTIYTLIFALILLEPTHSQIVPCELLQLKNNHLYFDIGRDELVFENSKFEIRKNDSLIYWGYIEHSYRDISVSEKLNDSTLMINDSLISYFIEKASIDSTSSIYLNFDNSHISKNYQSYLIQSNPTTQNGNKILFNQSNSSIDLLENSNGSVTISFTESSSSNNSHSPMAPFYVALVPNLSKRINADGFLATSLYYRYNYNNLNNLFDGDNAIEYNSHFKTISTKNRSYKYNRETGKKLSKEILKTTNPISISYQDKTLESLAIFFADILSRDKFIVTLRENNLEADISLMYFPICSSGNITSFEFVAGFLEGKRNSAKRFREQIDLILNRYSSAIEKNEQQDVVDYYLDLINRSLIEDLAFFPLFRPRSYYSYSSNLIDIEFDNNNRLIIDSLSLVKLPVRAKEFLPTGDGQ